MKEIIIKDLNVSYGDKRVLYNYNEVFEAGKINIIMGASGSGKTTLMKLLLKDITSDSGDIINFPEEFSAVFQENRLCEDFSVISNVKLVLDNKHKKENIKEYIYNILDRLNIRELAAERVKNLSGGQKRRVAIARAIAYDAELFILDEAFKGLDEKNLYLCMEYMKEVLRGKTAIIITHNKEEADFFGGNIKLLS